MPLSDPDPKVAVQVPAELHQRIARRIQGSAFTSVDEFVAFVLGRLAEADARSGEPLSAQDEARVRERLKALGYID